MSLKILNQPTEEIEQKAFDSTRGVKNPLVIDLISLSPDKSTVLLTMLEDRSWDDETKLLHDLEEKLNAYLAYVLDKFLAQQYQQYAGLKVQFQYESLHPIPPAISSKFQVISNLCRAQGLSFSFTDQVPPTLN